MRRCALALAFTTSCADAPRAEPALDQPPVRGNCQPDDEDDDSWADCVDTIEPAPGVAHGHDRLPDIVLGPPVPGPAGAGSTDVASLGCGGTITVAFAGDGIVDGPGPDLLVFENPFVIPGGTFGEPAQVLASDDGETWWPFPCAVDGSARGCAGMTAVELAAATLPLDPDRAGGDSFDLAAVGLQRATWVRLLDRTAEHYGDNMWCRGPAGGFDLDALAAVGP